MKKVLITGINSYIGISFENHVKKINSDYIIDTIDMRDSSWEKLDFSSYDSILHVAGIVHLNSKKMTEEQLQLYYIVNRDLAVKVAKKAKKEKVKQFIYLSSMSIFGESSPMSKMKIIDNDTEFTPINDYGKSKLEAEIELNKLNSKDFNVAILRPPMVYGKGAKGNYNTLAKLAKILPIFPDTNNKRSMIHIDNLSEFIRLIVNNCDRGVFMPQNAEYVSTAEMVKLISKCNNGNIKTTKLFNLALRALSPFVGMIDKAFGNLVYDLSVSDYKEDYRIVNLEESIKRTEEKDKKVLFTATVDSHIKHFHMPYLKMFKEKGYEVHVATNGDEEIEYCDVKHKISFERSPFKINNLKAIKKLKGILKKENFELIHTHTPMGSAVTRLAAKKSRKNGTRVIYTAHGLHFFKGAPLLNWIMFYPIEKYLSKYTDDIILINNEDFNLAKKKFKAKNIHYIPGVGVDQSRFDFEMTDKEKMKLFKELGLAKNDFVIMYTAELNKNKNQSMAIKAIAEVVKEKKNVKLLLAGDDSINGKYQELVKELKLDNNVLFLGYRKDIPQLLKIANLVISTSRREGLPVNLMEALTAGKPIIATNSRGNRDLAEDSPMGTVVGIDDVEMLKTEIIKVINDKKEYAKDNRYTIDTVKNLYWDVYSNNSTKTVLHLLNSNKYSGAENVVITIINNLKSNDKIRNIYVCPEGDIRNHLESNNIEYEAIEKLSHKEIKRVMLKYNAKVVHAHDFRASTAVGTMNLKKNIVTISHLHNNPPWIKKISIKTLLYLFASLKFDKILLVSESITNEYVFAKSIKEKTEVVGNPIDFTRIRELALEKCDSKSYDIIFIGRLTEQKQPLFFIELVKTLKENNKIKDLKVAMLGDGELKEDCIELIKKLELTNTIDLLGFVNNPYNILNNSKLLCIPSKFEGYGLVAVESLALGKPVVAAAVGGLVNIVDEKIGLLCNKKEDYENELTKLLTDEKYYKLKQENIKKTLENKYNIEKYIDSVLEIYN